jgi:hypothetical protein
VRKGMDEKEEEEDRILEELARNPPTEAEKNEIISNFVKRLPVISLKTSMTKSLVGTPLNTFPECLLRIPKYYDGMLVLSCGKRSLVDDNFEELGYTNALKECTKCGGFTTAMITTTRSYLKRSVK